MAGAVPKLICMLQINDLDTRGFAAACMLCLCKDSGARSALLSSGGIEPLLSLAIGPPTWLRAQVIEMLRLLHVPIPNADGLFERGALTAADDSTATAPPSAIEPRKGVFVARSKLKVRMACELDSGDAGDLPMGAQVHVAERSATADGTKRASVIKDGGERPMGWVSLLGKDGQDNLIPTDDPDAADIIAGIVRSLSVRHPLQLPGLSDQARSMIMGHSGASGSLTVRMKFHFWSYQMPTNRNS